MQEIVATLRVETRRVAVRSTVWLDLFWFVMVGKFSNEIAFFISIRVLDDPINNL
jgi:hypothetical protein